MSAHHFSSWFGWFLSACYLFMLIWLLGSGHDGKQQESGAIQLLMYSQFRTFLLSSRFAERAIRQFASPPHSRFSSRTRHRSRRHGIDLGRSSARRACILFRVRTPGLGCCYGNVVGPNPLVRREQIIRGGRCLDGRLLGNLLHGIGSNLVPRARRTVRDAGHCPSRSGRINNPDLARQSGSYGSTRICRATVPPLRSGGVMGFKELASRRAMSGESCPG